MISVEPIWEDEWVTTFALYFKDKSQRDFVMFMTGLYTGLRISDILPLRVYQIEVSYLVVYEEKTGKLKRIPLHPHLMQILQEYTKGMGRMEYLFKSRKSADGKTKPIGRKQAYRIIKDAAEVLEYPGNLGTHSMRKTFGWRYYQEHKDVAELKDIYNHSDENETYRYLGILRERIEKKIVRMKNVKV